MVPKILVIIPAYNEEASLRTVVKEVRAAVPGTDILVVDDGSADRTAATARDAGAGVVELPFNCGIGVAIQTGFLYARDIGYDIAVQVDGDGQHDPAGIPALIDPITRGETDVVIGSRFLRAGGFRSSVVRRMGIWIFRVVNSAVLGQHISDNTSGFRAYNRRAIDYLAANYPHDYPEPEAVVSLGLAGFRIREIPVIMRERQGGVSSIGTTRPVYYMVKVLLAIVMNVIRVCTQRIRRRS